MYACSALIGVLHRIHLPALQGYLARKKGGGDGPRGGRFIMTEVNQ